MAGRSSKEKEQNSYGKGQIKIQDKCLQEVRKYWGRTVTPRNWGQRVAM
jgi:hypothetical protein